MGKLKSFLAVSLLAATALVPSFADAQVRERKLRLGLQTNLNTAQGRATQNFADLVSQKSEGKLKVDVFPGGSLGGDLQTISALRGGTIDATVLATSTLVGTVKEFGLFDLPYLFDSDAEAMTVVDGPFGQRLNKLLEEKNLVGLAYWGAGFRHLTNNKRPVTKVDDVKGLKVRVLQNPIYIDLWNRLGANAVPMPFPELFSALEQGAVDGQENPTATIISSKLNEVQKHLSLTQHVYFVSSLVLSKPTWDKLNNDERKVIRDAATEAQVKWRKEVIEEDKTITEQLKKVMQVNEVTKEELARFREMSRPVVEKHSAAADPAAVKDLMDSLAKARGK
jgi:tripartite ATP-independent transporter DctP family solute receptor